MDKNDINNLLTKLGRVRKQKDIDIWISDKCGRKISLLTANIGHILYGTYHYKRANIEGNKSFTFNKNLLLKEFLDEKHYNLSLYEELELRMYFKRRLTRELISLVDDLKIYISSVFKISYVDDVDKSEFIIHLDFKGDE